nr:hypothetical protein [Chloroflexota bacterium]
ATPLALRSMRMPVLATVTKPECPSTSKKTTVSLPNSPHFDWRPLHSARTILRVGKDYNVSLRKVHLSGVPRAWLRTTHCKSPFGSVSTILTDVLSKVGAGVYR